MKIIYFTFDPYNKPMPKNKEALSRYHIINRCLRDYRYVTLQKLEDKCFDAFDHEISRRTLEQDIHDMRYDRNLGYYAPILYDRSQSAYRYDDPDYSIDNFPLSAHDLEALTFASAMLDQYRNMEIISDFAGAVQKILDAMKIRRSLLKEPGRQVVGFENFPVNGGSEWLTVILDSILGRKALSIEHHRFDSNEVHHHVVHPYFLKEYGNRWYLVGWQAAHKRIQSFGLERILELKVLPEEPFFDSGFDPVKYYQHAIGVIVTDDKPEKITLRFTAKQGKYILTQPIHSSQETVSESPESIVIRVRLTANYEFISMILGWGPDVEVVAPEAFRLKVKQMVADMLKQY